MIGENALISVWETHWSLLLNSVVNFIFQISKAGFQISQTMLSSNYSTPAPKSTPRWNSSTRPSTPANTKSQRATIQSLVQVRNKDPIMLKKSTTQIRSLIISNNAQISSSDRVKVWKILLSIYSISALDYVTLCDKGPSFVAEKIKFDVNRTLATDHVFTSKVGSQQLDRFLNAFVWKVSAKPKTSLVNLKFSYTQGMNVLAAPFLYTLPELDAFYAFNAMITSSCPLYVQPNLEGVHCGVKLIDKILEIVDLQVYNHLKACGLNASLYAFPLVATLSACSKPLSEVIKLWDFLIAGGFHLNLFAIVGQIVMSRNDILASDSPMKIIKHWLLDSKRVVETIQKIVNMVDDELYDVIIKHMNDPFIYEVIMDDSF